MKNKNVTEIKKSLRINTKLIVSLASSRENNNYDSSIQDIEDDKIVITLPSRKGVPITVMKGTQLHISALLADGRAIFTSKVEGVITSPVYMLILEIPDFINREQVRNFYRVPVHLRVKVLLINDIKEGDTVSCVDGLVDDISGGGCRLSSKASLREGYNIILDFTDSVLDGVEHILCQVIRVSTKPGGKTVASLKFQDVDHLTEDHIVRYVFRRQLELKKMASDK
ncbi:MAG: flagellar brake domain-containing protein [Deferribacteraceae bacterium]|nr:flagellar brake domain-containing protein [Deferribacteraceae bacterium]